MSIAVIDQIWKHSRQKGACLLVLLAIGDFADDSGTAFPAVETLAKKARVSERSVQYALRQIQASGELVIDLNAGPKGCNVFRVQKLHGCKTEQKTAEGVQPVAPGGVQPIAPKPSEENRHKKRTVNKHTQSPDDPRRAPFVTHVFTSYVERFGELVPDKSDFGALKALLKKTKADLSELQSRWNTFLGEAGYYGAADQGHPLRFFCSNYTHYHANGSRASPIDETAQIEAHRKRIFGKLAK